VHVLIDDNPVGAAAGQSGGDGNMIDVGQVRVEAGPHVISLVRGGGGAGPGNDSGTQIDGIYLESVGVERETVATVRPQAWHSLCGRPLDWLEIT
jgi:hypothetical protein